MYSNDKMKTEDKSRNSETNAHFFPPRCRYVADEPCRCSRRHEYRERVCQWVPLGRRREHGGSASGGVRGLILALFSLSPVCLFGWLFIIWLCCFYLFVCCFLMGVSFYSCFFLFVSSFLPLLFPPVLTFFVLFFYLSLFLRFSSLNSTSSPSLSSSSFSSSSSTFSYSSS